MNPQYLGQPAPVPSKLPPQRAGISGRMTLIVGLLIVAVLAGIGLMVANRDTSGPLSQRLTLRMAALQDIIKDGKKNASSDKLTKITAEASLLLSGDSTAITAAQGKSKTKASAAITNAENSKPALERLKQAKINAVYDTAYSSELTAKLESTSALIRELYKVTKSKKLKTALNTTNIHITGLQKDLATP